MCIFEKDVMKDVIGKFGVIAFTVTPGVLLHLVKYAIK
jgi:hypothetical protein